MKEQETHADIIAWLRRPREGENAYLTAWRDEIADRLEAAIKREKTAIEADALTVGGMVEAARKRERGDAAKLREAVGKILWCLKWMFDNTDDKSVQSHLGEPIALAKDALAAPPRNCDLARDWMRDLYAHFQPPASVKREMPPEWVDAVMAFCKWLVAPATEKEGDNDGNE